VSTSSSGAEANAESSATAISGDGRYVAFNSSASNLVSGDSNGATDAFIKDTVTGTTTRVSTNASGVEGNGYTAIRALTDDGRYALLYSYATNLVSGDTNGQPDSFIKDTVTGAITRVTTDSSGAQANNYCFATSMSADGRYVAFTSSATNLVTGDTNGAVDCFVKDTVTGEVTRANVDSSGSQSNAAVPFNSWISADGRYVAFDSAASNLVSGDSNGGFDTFVKDLTKAGIQILSGMAVATQASAGVTMNLVQTYRTELSTYRANMGASMSRVESFLSALTDSKLTTAEASSRIQDANVAEEASALSAARIRQQIGASLLAQANKESELILQLLRNL